MLSRMESALVARFTGTTSRGLRAMQVPGLFHLLIRTSAISSTHCFCITESRSAGFLDQRMVECREIDVHDAGLLKVLGGAKFYSATYRLWKITPMEDACEDYGQAAVYNGTCADMPHAFALDDGHTFENGKMQLVCGNTALMLSRTRLGKYFTVFESSSERRHFGIFAGCGTNEPFITQTRKRPQLESAAPSCSDGGGT